LVAPLPDEPLHRPARGGIIGEVDDQVKLDFLTMDSCQA
jgi:hypothetical protein